MEVTNSSFYGGIQKMELRSLMTPMTFVGGEICFRNCVPIIIKSFIFAL